MQHDEIIIKDKDGKDIMKINDKVDILDDNMKKKIEEKKNIEEDKS